MLMIAGNYKINWCKPRTKENNLLPLLF